MFRKLVLLLVSSISVFSGTIYAVGLGESKLSSGLNQPLKAEILLLSVDDLAEHELNMTLASPQEFDKVGVERLFILNDIRFKTVRNKQGNLIISLATHDTIKEPFLNFVVALNYPKGRFVKEYTFLLDPPIFEETVSSTIDRAQSSNTNKPKNPPLQTVKSERVKKTQQPRFSGSTFGPISANDTLWGIANKTRPNSNVSIHQTLVAIYRANPHAFAKGNINNLLRGEVLQIPDAETIAQVPHRAALQDVVVQNRQWQSGGTSRIVDNNATKNTTKRTSGEARLSLATQDSQSESNSGQNASSGDAALLNSIKDDLVRSQEKSASLEAENEELRSRLSDLLEKLEGANNNSAINIADAELAALTNNQSLTEELGGDEEMVVDPTEAESDNKTIDSTELKNQQELVTNENNAADEIKTSPETVVEKAVKDRTIPNVYTPEPKKSFVEEMLDSSYFLIGLLVVIVLIVLIVFWRMRKRMEEEDFQDDLVASAGAGSMDNTEEFELPDVGDDMLVELEMDDAEEDFSEAKDESFDPLGEADIYIAYGKFEQAENLLLESIEDYPERSDLKVKLLECYAENENKDKFDSLADEIAFADDAEDWQEQIDTLREQTWLSSENANDEFDLPSTEDIFGGETADFETPTDASEIESSEDAIINSDSLADIGESDNQDGDSFSLDDESFSLDDVDDESFSLDDVSEESTSEENESFSLDDIDDIDDTDDSLSLGSEEHAHDDDGDDDEEFDLDMDIDLGLDDDDDLIASPDAVTETFNALDDETFSLDDEDAVVKDDSDDLALDIEDDSLDLDYEPSMDDEAVLDDDDYGDDFDSDDEDEISTKLDLARAYIDMGDSDGARDILMEVVADGNDEQKKEAQNLLDKSE